MAKRILCLVASIVALNAHTVVGQVRSEYFRSLSADLQLNGGLLSQKITAIPFSENYEDALNAVQGNIKFSGGQSKGYDFRLGYYFNHKRTLGIGLGINYYQQKGTLSLDTFHIEYRASSDSFPIFRQVISTTRGIKETIVAKSYNIPFLLRYKKDFNDKIALTVDAGIVYNLQVGNSYETDARFDYEAIYKFEGNELVYDNQPVPDQSSLLITKAEYQKDFPKGDVVKFFMHHDSIGKSVGLNMAANEKTGKVAYKSGSLGYTGEVAVNYMVVRNICIRAGLYYTAQSFTNTSNNNARTLTDHKIKDATTGANTVNYNSLLNEMQTAKSSNYGMVLGARIYFNRMAWKAPTDDVNRVTPAKGRAH